MTEIVKLNCGLTLDQCRLFNESDGIDCQKYKPDPTAPDHIYDKQYELYRSVLKINKDLVNKACKEYSTRQIMEIKRLECSLGICKDQLIQDRYNYLQLLKQESKERAAANKTTDSTVKIKKLNSFLITVNFKDECIKNNRGVFHLSLICRLMKSFLNYKWVKESNIDKLQYQVESRDYYRQEGLHIHITIFQTYYTKSRIIDLGKSGALFSKYIGDKASIDVRAIYNEDGLDNYISELNLKNDDNKRQKQINDRLLQQEYNKHVKGDMLESNVVPAQD